MITQLIFDWSKKTPDRTALIYNGQSWSYRSFAQAIGIARGYFARRGFIGHGYAILAVHSLIDFWILSLALRSLGLSTVPVALSGGVRRLGLPNVRCVVTSPTETWIGLESICAELGLPLLSESLVGQEALDYEPSEEPQSLGGHITRTSGTTGIHKMVLMTPEFDADFMRRKVKLLGLNQDSVFSVFDFRPWTGVGYKCTVTPWLVGGATLIDQGRARYHALVNPNITHAMLAPVMLSDILNAPPAAFPRNDALQLAVGGGFISQSQVDQAKARITPHLFNWLASTEAGTVAYTPLDIPEDRKWHQLLPGRLTEIVDEYDRPVPIGEIGRLRVSTAGGPTSYHNDELATRTFFKEGFFYPGDLAVMRSDRRLMLQGRITEVINVKGEKISPAPIEDRLCEHFNISGICLLSGLNDSGEEDIHAVIETPTPIDSERLMAAISRELGGFHRIHIRYVAALPRNEMGKIVRQRVRDQTIVSQVDE